MFEKFDGEKKSLCISRYHQKGALTRSVAVLRNSEFATKTFHGVDQIADALQEFCGINEANLERILIKQQNASSIACNKPGKLLECLEMFVGTDKIHSAAKACFLEGNRISLERKCIMTTIETILQKVKLIQPSMDIVTALKVEQHELDSSLLKLYASEKRLLEVDETQAARKMQSTVDSHSKILKSVEISAGTVSSLNIEIKLLASDERRTKRDKERCDDLLLESEVNLEKTFAENKNSIKKETAKLQKVKGLLKLVRSS